MDTVLREFLLGFVKIHILHHAAQEPVYGVALIEELRRHGYELSPGTLYPVLHAMEEAGYLARDNRIVGGKVRKYYTTTDAGRDALDEARPKIRELVTEVLEGHGPPRLPARLTRARKERSRYERTDHPAGAARPTSGATAAHTDRRARTR
jgi:DNA-binding PadR family transcriptional regulator